MVKYVLALCFLLVGIKSQAAPSPDLWDFWNKADLNSQISIDHSLWQGFLDRYVKHSDSTNMYMVEYGRVKRADRLKLSQYLQTLAVQDPRKLAPDEQFAYWVNLYNALTVNLILDYYPVKSITKLGKGWFRTGPWRDELITIAGHAISLDDIEHRILRPIWKDPRIHFVLNCASIGCPDLMPEVYESEKIDEQLNNAARRFINQAKGVSFVGKRLILSSIFDWYEEDFRDQAGVMKELKSFANSKLLQQLNAYRGRISYRYDWKLNQYKP